MLRHDLRYACRTLARTPGFTATAIAVLAIGLGVNAVVFSLANAFFLRPLPVEDPGTLVRVYLNRFSNVPYATYLDLRDRNASLSGLAAFQGRSFGLGMDGETEHVFGEIVTGEYFTLLGVRPARGRMLVPSDDRAGAAPAAVLSHAFWTRRFGAAEEVVGQTIALNDRRFTIVGVAPRTFTGVLAPLAGELWVPLSTDALLRPGLDDTQRRSLSLHLIGRLKPGIARGQAQAELESLARQLRRDAGEPEPRGAALTVYGSTMLHPEASSPVTIFTSGLMAVMGLVLLIVCVNVANLVLARGLGRQAELAIRQSLGAGKGRLIRQLLTENLMLSLAGACGGLVLATWCTRLLSAIRIPAPVPLALALPVDWRVLAFTSLLAVAAALASGALPALAASRVDLTTALKGAAGQSPQQHRWRSRFLVAQIAMSVLLLVTAGLLVRSVHQAVHIDTGFAAANVMTATIDLETRGYDEARGRDFIRRLAERLDAAPALAAATLADIVPLTLSNTASYLLREGDSVPARGERPALPAVYMNAVSPRHFETLGIRLLAGRDFRHEDDGSARNVGIVNETLARQFWPGKDAVGQRLRPMSEDAGPEAVIEIVGVARDSKYVTVGEAPRPFLYRPLAQAYTPRLTILAKSNDAPAAAIAAIKGEVRALDPGLAVFNTIPLAEATAISLLPSRVAGTLVGSLGLLALALAGLGLYGVLSFLVHSRTREIGVRVALGAGPGAVAALVIRQALTWTFTGIALGMTLAFAMTRFIGAFLYGVSATDPLTFAGVLIALAFVACLAAAIPARRATRLDPLTALRTL